MFKGFMSLFKQESLLDQALVDTQTMLQDVRTMVKASHHCLRLSDSTEMELDIALMDKAVNRYEAEVRRKVFTHLSVVGSENIYASLVLISIIIDVERVGDYAKNIMELATEHAPRLLAGPFEDDLKRIEDAVIGELLSAGIECFIEHKEEEAIALLHKMAWVNPACDRIVRVLVAGNEEMEISPRNQITLALYVRYMKRINAHWLNILTSVVNPFDRIGFRKDF
jgi:phosphate transport system protein